MKKEKTKQEQTQGKEKNKPDFAIQKLYIKNSSFEAPHATQIFQSEWNPMVNLDLNIETNTLQQDTYEVVLRVTVTTKLAEKTAFLAEISQAGIFSAKGFKADELKPMLGAFCPNILFPYAREAISSLVNHGGFPPLYLAPINFDALYQQQLESEQKDKGGRIIH